MNWEEFLNPSGDAPVGRGATVECGGFKKIEFLLHLTCNEFQFIPGTSVGAAFLPLLLLH